MLLLLTLASLSVLRKYPSRDKRWVEEAILLHHHLGVVVMGEGEGVQVPGGAMVVVVVEEKEISQQVFWFVTFVLTAGMFRMTSFC